MRIQLHYQSLTERVFGSLDNITAVSYAVFVSVYSEDTSVVVRQFQRGLNSFRQKPNPCPPLAFFPRIL